MEGQMSTARMQAAGNGYTYETGGAEPQFDKGGYQANKQTTWESTESDSATYFTTTAGPPRHFSVRRLPPPALGESIEFSCCPKPRPRLLPPLQANLVSLAKLRGQVAQEMSSLLDKQ